MTVLVDYEIKNAIRSGDIEVTFFDESLLNPASLDIRLGHVVGTVHGMKESVARHGQGLLNQAYTEITSPWGDPFNTIEIIDPLDKDSFNIEYIDITGRFCLVPPNSYVLASMYEDTKVLHNISTKIVGKSSMARLGCSNSDAAGWAEVGWSGNLTMEIFNHNNKAFLKLTHGMKIGQLLFYQHHTPENDYSKKGRYLNQKPGQGSKGV